MSRNSSPWTTAEERFLAERAGIDPVRQICKELKRTRSSVMAKASRMGVSLRTYEPLTVICPKCGMPRDKRGSWTGRTGFCEVCKLNDAYRTAKWAQAEAYSELPPEARAVYDRTEAKVGRSRLPPKPPQPPLSNLPAARKRRIEELHAIDVEQWEVRCLTLLIDATKQRTKRMREKVGANPRKYRKEDKEDKA